MKKLVSIAYRMSQIVEKVNWERQVFRKKSILPKDRYGIAKLVKIEFLYKILKQQNEYNFHINQCIILLYRIIEVSKLQNMQLKIIPIKLLTNRILKKLYNPQDYPTQCFYYRIGKFVLAFSDNSELQINFWLDIFDSIILRKYDDDPQDLFALVKCMSILIAMNGIEKKLNEIEKTQFLPCLRFLSTELTMHIKTRKYNLPSLRVIIQIYGKYKCGDYYFWQQVCYFIDSYLESFEKKPMQQYFIMEVDKIQKQIYSRHAQLVPLLQTLTIIGYYLSKNDILCQKLFVFVQRLIEIGITHKNQMKQLFQSKINYLYQSNYDIKLIYEDPIKIADSFLSKLQFFVSYISFKNPLLKLKPQINSWIVFQIIEGDNSFSINDLLIFYKTKDSLPICQEQLMQFLQYKMIVLDTARYQYSFEELQEYMTILSMQYEENKLDYIRIPKKLINHVQYLSIRIMRNSHPKNLLQYVRFLQKSELLPFFNQFFIELPALVNNFDTYYSFDQKSYYFYILIVNDSYWREKNSVFEGEMNILKESIKLSTNTRGFKMDMNSYFFKLLNHIDDLAQFFEDTK